MPKISHNSLIDLTAFRQKNSLLQQDLADYLGVSRGYISMVEKGASKLSRKNLDRIYEAESTKQWDLADLVPAYTRYKALEYYLNYTRNIQLGFTPDNCIDYFESDPLTEEKLRYGEIGLSENMSFLREWCESAPEINREWVLTGKGEMLKNDVCKKEPSTTLELLFENQQTIKAYLVNFEANMLHKMGELERLILSMRSE